MGSLIQDFADIAGEPTLNTKHIPIIVQDTKICNKNFPLRKIQ